MPVLPRSEVTILAPVTRPDKVVCVGMNYMDHCREQNVPVPKEPIIFSKFGSSIVGPYDEIVLPPESQVGRCLSLSPSHGRLASSLKGPPVAQ